MTDTVISSASGCTVHKRRNVAEHLPESERGWVDAELVRALNNPDAAVGLRDAKASRAGSGGGNDEAGT
jgi:putative transposase